ncbi:MAG: EamA family transporter [Clostridia bacterium]|nr:EamA family transporter [Clostridia bacterium]
MKKRALIYIILAGIFWGTSGIFVHYLAPFGFSSLEMTGMRALVSFLVILIFALIRNRSLLKLKPIMLPLLFGIGAMLFLTAYFYYSAMQQTSVSTAVVLMYTAPIYVIIISVLFFGEKFTPMKIVAVVMMLIGCAFVSGIIGGLKFDPIGILIGVGSGLTYAAYNVFTKIAMRKGVEPVTVTLYSFAFMTAISCFGASPADIVSKAAVDPAVTWPLLIGLGIFTFVTPYFLYTLAMKELPAGTVSALGIVEPMAACAFSIIIFKEKPDVFSIIGILMILVATFLIGKSEE